MKWLLPLLLFTAGLAGCATETVEPEDESFSDELDESLQATATTGIIRGVVIDETITPVEGATITLVGVGTTTESNPQGAFGFDALDPGTYFLQVSKIGFNGTQTSTAVEAGVDRPPIVKMLLERAPKSGPYVISTQHNGFLACGVAVFATSLGCTTLGPLADATDSTSIWDHTFDSDRIMWTQGEMVWEQTQPGGGEFIWEITIPGTNDFIGYRETTSSPALAFVNDTVLAENPSDIVTDGVNYRFFGGPHPICKLPEVMERPPEAPAWYTFGCGLTIDQAAEVFIHDFYNFVPEEGWRFTSDGNPVVPG